MALVSNPRLFFQPAFLFEKNGRFIASDLSSRPTPNKMFACNILEKSGESFPLLPERELSELHRLRLDEETEPVISLCSKDSDAPLFWRTELFTCGGRECDETAYVNFWKRRKCPELSYVAFDTKVRPLDVRGEGRLLNLLLYFLLFEADEADKIVKIVQNQSIQTVVVQQWEALMLSATVDFGTRGTLVQQFVRNYGATSGIVEILTPRAKRGFKAFFGLR